MTMSRERVLGRELPGTWAREGYGAMPRQVRWHVMTRWLACPFDAVEAEVPLAGRVLDVGCGHGAFALGLAEGSPERLVVGVDVDEEKVDVARLAADAVGADNVAFEHIDCALDPFGDDGGDGWDAITIVDVLYLLGTKEARCVIAEAAGRLRPGGVIVVKESAMRPWWKFQLARVEELLATKVARVTRGDGVWFVPPEEIAAAMAQSGLDVTRRRVDRGRVHPHHLIVGSAGSEHRAFQTLRSDAVEDR